MKTSLSAVLMGVLMISLFSCQKELSFETSVNNNNGRNGPPGNFHAKIDGAQWVSADNMKSASILSGIISITGISSDNKMITMTLIGQNPGTYAFNQNSLNFASYDEISGGNIVSSFSTNQSSDTSLADGTVTILQIDSVNKTISGTFQFKVYNEDLDSQILITEGVFDALPYVSSLPPASGTDTLTVNIDGTDWSAPGIASEMVSGQLFIQGSELDGSKSVNLFMPGNVSPGFYTLDFSGGLYIGEYSPSPGNLLVSQGSGTLTILENNASTRRIRGNFSFIASDLALTESSELTDGYFSVGY